jgi:ketosteroid isomerase-like protein
MCASWKSGDAEKIAGFVTEDFKFRGSAERMEAPPTRDRQAFVEQIQKFLSGAKVEMVIHDTFARGSVVVNIHQQLFDVKDQGLREDWYIGVFHLTDGKIREWNDYAIVPFSAPRQARPASFGKFVRGAD